MTSKDFDLLQDGKLESSASLSGVQERPPRPEQVLCVLLHLNVLLPGWGAVGCGGVRWGGVSRERQTKRSPLE